MLFAVPALFHLSGAVFVRGGVAVVVFNSGKCNELASLYRCFWSVCLVVLGCVSAFWLRCTCVFVPALRLVGTYRGSRLLGSSFVRIVD